MNQKKGCTPCTLFRLATKRSCSLEPLLLAFHSLFASLYCRIEYAFLFTQHTLSLFNSRLYLLLSLGGVLLDLVDSILSKVFYLPAQLLACLRCKQQRSPRPDCSPGEK